MQCTSELVTVATVAHSSPHSEPRARPCTDTCAWSFRAPAQACDYKGCACTPLQLVCCCNCSSDRELAGHADSCTPPRCTLIGAHAQPHARKPAAHPSSLWQRGRHHPRQVRQALHHSLKLCQCRVPRHSCIVVLTRHGRAAVPHCARRRRHKVLHNPRGFVHAAAGGGHGVQVAVLTRTRLRACRAPGLVCNQPCSQQTAV